MLGISSGLMYPSHLSSSPAPDDVDGILLWLKANTGMVGNAGGLSENADIVDGEDINSWADQSGNGRHAVQTIAARKPHWETDVADLGGLGFTASASHHFLLDAGNPSITISANTDFTVMTRIKITDFSAARNLLGNSAQDVLKFPDEKSIKTLIGGTGAKTWAEASATLATDTYYVITLTRSGGSDGDLEVRVHGGEYSDKSWDSDETHQDADAFQIETIGSSHAGSGTPFHGKEKGN